MANFIKGILKRNLKESLVIMYTGLFSIILAVTVFVNVVITTGVIKNNMIDYTEKTIEATNNKVDSVLNKMVSFSRLAGYNSEIQNILIEFKNLKTENRWDFNNSKKMLDKAINSLLTEDLQFSSIQVYFSPDKIYTYNDVRINDSTFIEKIDLKDFSILDRNINWVPSFIFNSNTSTLSMRRLIVDSNTLQKIAVLIIDTPTQFLNDIFSNSKSNKLWEFFLINRSNTVISSSDTEINGKKFSYLDSSKIQMLFRNNNGSINIMFKGKPALLIYAASSIKGWKTIGIIPMSEIYNPVLNNQLVLILIGIIGLLIALIMSTIIASSITKPINKIIKAMREVGAGKMDIKILDNSFQETVELSEGFNKMQQDLKEHVEKEYILTLRNKEAEFNTLQAQINPHFLFNTLETINCMLIVNGKNDVSELITSLGDILRYSISKREILVSIQMEMEYIEKYLYIQKARFGDKLKYKIECDEASKKCKIIRFILQPLVENSIIHGLEKKRGDGLVTITSYVDNNNCLTIVIEDNGVGVRKKVLKMLMEDTFEKEDQKGHLKLGVQNVNKRIKLYYGNEYGLQIESRYESGMQADSRYESGLQADSRYESGLQTESRHESGLQAESRYESGLQIESRHESGTRVKISLPAIEA